MTIDLYPKFKEKPSKGQNKTLTMFLHGIACPFHSAIYTGLGTTIDRLFKVLPKL